MGSWYTEVFQHWPLTVQLLAYISLGLQVVAALWLFYDAQRYEGRLQPLNWAIFGLLCAPLALGVYWFSTGSPRAAMAFAVTFVTALVMTGMYDRPIQRAVDLQMGHSLQAFPISGVRTLPPS